MTPPRRRAVLGVALVVVVVLVVGFLVARAVREDDAASPTPEPTAAPGPSPTPEPTSSPEPTVSPGPEPSPTQPPTGSPADVVLGLGGAVGEELWQPEEQALAMLAAALGEPGTTAEAADCTDGVARRVHRWGDFTVHVSLEPLDPGATVPGLEPVEPPFVDGWALRGPSPALATRDGLAVGDTVEDLLAAYPEATESPAAENAWEVFLGDFSNLWVETTSTDPGGTVTALVSGSDCVLP